MTANQLHAQAFRVARKAGLNIDTAESIAQHVVAEAFKADPEHARFRRNRRHIIADHSAEWLIETEVGRHKGA